MHEQSVQGMVEGKIQIQVCLCVDLCLAVFVFVCMQVPSLIQCVTRRLDAHLEA
jgi:hypothetical protein